MHLNKNDEEFQFTLKKKVYSLITPTDDSSTVTLALARRQTIYCYTFMDP